MVHMSVTILLEVDAAYLPVVDEQGFHDRFSFPWVGLANSRRVSKVSRSALVIFGSTSGIPGVLHVLFEFLAFQIGGHVRVELDASGGRVHEVYGLGRV